MPKIFEIFGHRIGDETASAKLARKNALCPFMGKQCDGGGNRYASQIRLDEVPLLRNIFDPSLKNVPSGVCSIQINADESPWIVCPRRLLSFDRSTTAVASHDSLEQRLIALSGFAQGTKLGVWSEVKIKVTSQDDESADDAEERSFDYTFDYVIFPLGRVSLQHISDITGLNEKKLLTTLEKSGFTLSMRDGDKWVEDFPVGSPMIIEIMTSSTSGGNKRKGTTIPMAFANAMTNSDHQAPGINYRQVWARMVSQLIVKSEVGLAWGGRTVWVLQDLLVDYISQSTKLNIKQFLSATASEVNILTLSYDPASLVDDTTPAHLTNPRLYAGPIAAEGDDLSAPSFEDIIHAGDIPPLSKLLSVIAKKPRVRTIET